MKNQLNYLLLLILVLTSCTIGKEKPRETPRLLVTSQEIKGLKFGYSEDMGPTTYYHMVEFPTDSTAFILMGGDVMEAAHYYTQADSIYVTLDYSDPPYTTVFGYKDGELIDRRGQVWTIQGR